MAQSIASTAGGETSRGTKLACKPVEGGFEEEPAACTRLRRNWLVDGSRRGRSETGKESDMPTNDLQINSKIRAIFARHWVDAEKLQFRTTAGTVRFHGVLARQGSFTVCDADTTLLEVLINEIRRISGVQKVYFTGVEVEHNQSRRVAVEDDGIDSCETTSKGKLGAPEAARARAGTDMNRSRTEPRDSGALPVSRA
jgi:hypothetical protein